MVDMQNTPNPDAAAATVGKCDALGTVGTWAKISPSGVGNTQALTLDPFNVGTVWLGASSISKVGAGGVYKSTDCGATFTHVNTGNNGTMVDNAAIWSMAVDYIDPGVLYVVGAYGSLGVWKSTNDGVDWTQLIPPKSEAANILAGGFIASVVMDPTDHLHLVVAPHGGCAAPYDPICVGETFDGGGTWRFAHLPGDGWAEQAGPYIISGGTWVYSTLFAGTWSTTDSGANWKLLSTVGGSSGGEFAHRPLARHTDGNYYLPGFNHNGLLQSTDGIAWTFTPIDEISYTLGFAIGDGNFYVGDGNGANYKVAAASDLTKWSNYPPAPAMHGSSYLEYDEAHHILYSSNFEGGLWRIVTR